jgi:ribonuclease VapC
VIVDSSALLALVYREEPASRIEDAIMSADLVAVGAPTLAETTIVLATRMGEDARSVIALLTQQLDLVVVPFTLEHAQAAREAHLRFGRGRHRAALNFGDCLCYAVAKLAAQPLLFVGDGFRHTDLVAVL